MRYSVFLVETSLSSVINIFIQEQGIFFCSTASVNFHEFCDNLKNLQNVKKSNYIIW